MARIDGHPVELPDAGQRLPVRLPPDRAFSRRHLDFDDGKPESWYVLEADPGDGILDPAGLAHATGEGIFVVEAREPTDLSILLDWSGLPIHGQVEGHLNLGFPTALQMVDRTA